MYDLLTVLQNLFLFTHLILTTDKTNAFFLPSAYIVLSVCTVLRVSHKFQYQFQNLRSKRLISTSQLCFKIDDKNIKTNHFYYQQQPIQAIMCPHYYLQLYLSALFETSTTITVKLRERLC